MEYLQLSHCNIGARMHLNVSFIRTLPILFRIFVSLRMTYPRSKHVALLDTQTMLSKNGRVLTDIIFL